jgi:tRNA G26 N,N-dimethylase Trm1
VQIDKGPAKANESLKNVRSLIHCNICEDRAFYPDTNYVDGNFSVTRSNMRRFKMLFFTEHPYSLLSCGCKTTMPGKTAINIGPVWSGELFDPAFLQKMALESTNLPWKNDVHDILETLIEEGLCSSAESSSPQQKDSDTPSQVPEGNKKIRLQADIDHSTAPPFYFNLHTNQPKDSKMLKADKIVSILRNNGFRASRTHFDREAVKTNASASKLMHIIKSGISDTDKE